MKIFWSWQSDTPGNIGRFLIRDALAAAIDSLKRDLELVEPAERDMLSAAHLDQDRQGIPGSPDLARIILEKIEAASVFVADVTLVGVVGTGSRESEAPKKLINSNVAIELGYALHALTDRSLLMVMNEHYGSLKGLPFDLRQKSGPIRFNLAPKADKTDIQRAAAILKDRFAEAIKLCVSNQVEQVRQQTPFPGAPAADTIARYFTRPEVLAFGLPGEAQWRCDAERVVYMRLFPTFGTEKVGLARMQEIFNQQKPCPMSMVVGGIPRRNKYGPITFDPKGPATIEGLTQGFDTGELWGVNGQLFQPIARQRNPASPALTVDVFLTMIDFEKLFVRVLRNYVKVAAEVRLPLPYTLEVGAVGFDGAFLTVPGRSKQGETVGPIHGDEFHRRYSITDTEDEALLTVLRAFFQDFYDLAARHRNDLIPPDLMAGHQLPPPSKR